ncbi:MAG TPA: DUF5615 family PIN-like protein, partial [Saprospiraceae bacterium]|nr:DUF5615 family PIN-like protein [Saprospiraceae bacterium]
MIIILADESVDFRIVKALRASGLQVHAVLEIKSGMSDQDVLTIASQNQYIVLTSDKDFGDLTFRLKKAQNGIVLLRFFNTSIDIQIEKTISAFELYADQ